LNFLCVQTLHFLYHVLHLNIVIYEDGLVVLIESLLKDCKVLSFGFRKDESGFFCPYYDWCCRSYYDLRNSFFYIFWLLLYIRALLDRLRFSIPMVRLYLVPL
jgi:hypothetical protein